MVACVLTLLDQLYRLEGRLRFVLILVDCVRILDGKVTCGFRLDVHRFERGQATEHDEQVGEYIRGEFSATVPERYKAPRKGIAALSAQTHSAHQTKTRQHKQRGRAAESPLCRGRSYPPRGSGRRARSPSPRPPRDTSSAVAGRPACSPASSKACQTQGHSRCRVGMRSHSLCDASEERAGRQAVG